MTSLPLKGKGLLFVQSQITKPEVLNESTFVHWYESDHIPEVVNTSGIRSARRFVNVDPKAQEPYLSTYVVEDLAFLNTKEFHDISVQSDLLPSPGIVYDLVDFGVRYDNLVHIHEKVKGTKGAGKTLLAVTTDLKEGVSNEELERWYREEQCGLISKHKDHVRTTLFKSAYARSNAESRALKGLAANPTGPPPKAATYLTLHEFSCEPDEVKLSDLQQICASPWADRMLASLEKHDVSIYRLANEFGEKAWFREEDNSAVSRSRI